MSSSLIINILLGAVGVYVAKTIFFPGQKNKLPLPPGPKRLPLVGNILDLPKDCDWVHWTKHKSLYGPISSVTVFGQNIIIVNDEKITYELLDKRSSIHSDRPAFVFAGEMCGWETALSMQHYNDRWRAYRKNIAQYMGSRNAIVSFQPLQQVETHRFLRSVLDRPENLMSHIRTNAGTVILKIMYGYTTDKKANDPLVDLADEVMEQFSLASQTGVWLVDTLPIIRHLPDWLPGTNFKKTARRWYRALTEMGDTPYKFVQKQMSDGRAGPSYTAHYLDRKVTPEEEHVIKWSAFSMYAGGADTTVSAVYGFYLAMVLYPEVLKKAQEEIDSVVGPDSLPTFSDRERLPYVEAIVKETLRWNTVVPMGLPHVAMEDDVYNGYSIPKGSLILSNIWFTHNDPATYSEPELFKPERFLGANAAPDPHGSAFGYGRRICPGKDFADASLWLTIAYSLAAFNITKARDEQGREITPEAVWINGVISHPKDFKCSITARSSKAEALIRSVDYDHPITESDAETLRVVVKEMKA